MIESGFERLGRIVIGGIFLIVPSYVPVQSPSLYWLFTVTGIIMILTGLIGYSPLYHYQVAKKKK
jgi:hypothetical protein